MAVQTGLHWTWSKTPKTGFLRTRLKSKTPVSAPCCKINYQCFDRCSSPVMINDYCTVYRHRNVKICFYFVVILCIFRPNCFQMPHILFEYQTQTGGQKTRPWLTYKVCIILTLNYSNSHVQSSFWAGF